MKKTPELPITKTAASGTLCPESGEWEITGALTTSAVLAKNQIMPDYCGKKVRWRLIRPG
ncbi:MAG: hypothetical protein K0M63_09510 [Weeksellaceae bacterium]|nr:hypothetical protein [Weeksellaceae bacterium]